MNEFQPVQISSELSSGDFKWAIKGNVEIYHDALTESEAKMFCWMLNRTAHTFREMIGLEEKRAKQLNLFLPPIAVLPGREVTKATQEIKEKKVKRRAA